MPITVHAYTSIEKHEIRDQLERLYDTSPEFGDGKDAVSSNGFSYARGFTGIDFKEAADMALRDGLPMIGASQPISSRLPVIFDPKVTAQFLAIISSMLLYLGCHPISSLAFFAEAIRAEGSPALLGHITAGIG